MPVAAKNTSSPETRSSSREDPVEVVAGVERGGAFVVVARPQAALDRAAEALERAGGDHAFGRAADAEQDVGARVAPRDRDRAGDVAVGDQRMRAPASRHSRMMSAWRSRSRITAVTSLTFSPSALATASRFAFDAAR